MSSYVKIGEIKLNNPKFAITKKEQTLGLMGVENPHVMIFPYKTADIRKFWMKNTPAPLDIIFCKAGKVIYIGKGNPFDESLVGPDLPNDLIIETKAGFCENNNIKIGSIVKVKYNKEALLKLIFVSQE